MSGAGRGQELCARALALPPQSTPACGSTCDVHGRGGECQRADGADCALLPLARGGRRSSRRRRSEAEAAQMGPQIVGLATGAAPRSGPLPHSRPWRYRRERRGALRCVRATPLAPQWCLGPCRRLSHHRACLRVSFRWRRCSARQSPLRQGRALDVASQKRAGRTAPWLRLSESPCRSTRAHQRERTPPRRRDARIRRCQVL